MYTRILLTNTHKCANLLLLRYLLLGVNVNVSTMKNCLHVYTYDTHLPPIVSRKCFYMPVYCLDTKGDEASDKIHLCLSSLNVTGAT